MVRHRCKSSLTWHSTCAGFWGLIFLSTMLNDCLLLTLMCVYVHAQKASETPLLIFFMWVCSSLSVYSQSNAGQPLFISSEVLTGHTMPKRTKRQENKKKNPAHTAINVSVWEWKLKWLYCCWEMWFVRGQWVLLDGVTHMHVISMIKQKQIAAMVT